MQQLQPNRSVKSLGAGTTWIVVVILFTLGGHWLDQKTGWSPLFLLTGLFLGFVGGFIHLVNAVAPEMLPFKKRPRASDSDADRSPDDEPTDEPTDP